MTNKQRNNFTLSITTKTNTNNFDNFLLSVSPGLDGDIMYIKNYEQIYITCKSSFCALGFGLTHTVSFGKSLGVSFGAA